MKEIWSVQIQVDTGDNLVVCCDRDTAQTFQGEWEEAMQATFEASTDILKIEGYTDTADRAPASWVGRADSIKGVGIGLMYTVDA